jgi:hypothetical protein
VQGILFGFIILKRSLPPSGFLDAIRVPNQNTRSYIEKRLDDITV